MFQKLKQFKDLRDKAKALQETLSTVHVESSAAWGKVKIMMDGNQSVTSITIDPVLMSPGEKNNLEAALKEAFNDAVKKAQQEIMKTMKSMPGFDMSSMTGGMTE